MARRIGQWTTNLDSRYGPSWNAVLLPRVWTITRCGFQPRRMQYPSPSTSILGRSHEPKKGSSGNFGGKELPTTENAEGAEARRPTVHGPKCFIPLLPVHPRLRSFSAPSTQAVLRSPQLLGFPPRSFLSFQPPLACFPLVLCVLWGETSFPEIPDEPKKRAPAFPASPSAGAAPWASPRPRRSCPASSASPCPAVAASRSSAAWPAAACPWPSEPGWCAWCAGWCESGTVGIPMNTDRG